MTVIGIIGAGEVGSQIARATIAKGPEVPVRVQPDLTALPAPPPPDDRHGYRTEMRHRFGTWNEITGTTAMPTEA
ncbi:hypothetical protein [Streptomyces sp. NBC_01320]|uniref:hypothetical protein n=1 Tax=Streptomyces sp. NBC_01320 TaxID=2903824 RepID=UPI003FA35822